MLNSKREIQRSARKMLKETVNSPRFVDSFLPKFDVAKAATAKSAKLWYPATKAARQLHFLRRFVPASAFDKSLRKQMKLPA